MTGPDRSSCQKLGAKSQGREALIVLVVFGIFILSASTTQAASLIGVSSVGAIEQGSTVPIEWFLDTGVETTINAIELELVFSTTTLRVSASPGRSLVSLWVKRPSVDNVAGTITLVGGVPGGVTGVIPLFRTDVTGVTEGPAVFALSNRSHVYAHDGLGTSLSLSFPQLQLAVAAPSASRIHSSTHPDQNSWYTPNNVQLAFTFDPLKQYSYTFTDGFNASPDAVPEETDGAVSYTDLADGVYYFRLAEVKKEGAQTKEGVFRVQIDQTPPEAFTPTLATSTDLFGAAPFISWTAVDKTSGIAYYEIHSGLFGSSRRAESPVVAKRSLVGDGISIRAYDEAGNYRDAFIPYEGYLSTRFFIILIGALVLLLGVWIVRRRFGHSAV